MNAMGDKISSKKMAIDAQVPIIPGVDYAIKDIDTATKIAAEVGFPIMLKASNGGGGRGMRIVNTMEDLEKEFNEAKNESKKAFGDDKIFIEKYLRAPKHIEVQILGDNYGNVVHLYDRDCSVQRRHQKVVEYAPAFSIPDETRQIIFDSAIRLSKAVGYRNAGTLEFLVDADNNPYFIEMNPRIQVEHTVSEEITNIDLVQSQILVAEGYPLDSDEINIKSQDDVHCDGYSIQTRVTTEDPANNFLPDTGKSHGLPFRLPETVSDLTVVTCLHRSRRLHLTTTAFWLRAICPRPHVCRSSTQVQSVALTGNANPRRKDQYSVPNQCCIRARPSEAGKCYNNIHRGNTGAVPSITQRLRTARPKSQNSSEVALSTPGIKGSETALSRPVCSA